MEPSVGSRGNASSLRAIEGRAAIMPPHRPGTCSRRRAPIRLEEGLVSAMLLLARSTG